MAALRATLLDVLTAEELGGMVRALVDKAKAGDVAAAKLVLAYSIGPPLSAADPDRLDEDEFSVERGKPTAVDRLLSASLRR